MPNNMLDRYFVSQLIKNKPSRLTHRSRNQLLHPINRHPLTNDWLYKSQHVPHAKQHTLLDSLDPLLGEQRVGQQTNQRQSPLQPEDDP